MHFVRPIPTASAYPQQRDCVLTVLEESDFELEVALLADGTHPSKAPVEKDETMHPKWKAML